MVDQYTAAGATAFVSSHDLLTQLVPLLDLWLAAAQL
jgi:hypothetical protein